MFYAAKRNQGYTGSIYEWINENPNAVSKRDANKLKPKMSKKEAGHQKDTPTKGKESQRHTSIRPGCRTPKRHIIKREGIS